MHDLPVKPVVLRNAEYFGPDLSPGRDKWGVGYSVDPY